MNYHFLLIPIALLLIFIILIIAFHLKKKSVIKKVNSLSLAEKNSILDQLSKPLGFLYDPYQDIFATRLDAPQKLFGYTHFYDLSAPYFNMIFDYETIYFDYNGKTWLIEIWKGQYGINTGCELGIYCADQIVSPAEYRSTHFHAVDARDMLDISLQLNQHSHSRPQDFTELGYQNEKHWWLTIFKMGIFSKPQDTSVNISIRFQNYPMMRSFLESYRKTLPATPCRVYGLTVYFTFYESSRTYSFLRRTIRRMSLTACRIYCGLFNYLTRSFTSSGSKILYLYYYLPFTIKLLFRLRSDK